MLVALAEVFYTNAVDVGSISGSCDVYLASVDEALKVFLLAEDQGFTGGGAISMVRGRIVALFFASKR